jgi:asparagine synthase (glutamine-hydrolysing)
MTAIAGAVSLDGQPADRALADRMLAALAHRGGIPMVQCAGAASLGVRHRGSPSRPPGGVIVAFHGALYEREALAVRLNMLNRAATSADDASLVAAAYRRWNLECVARISGEFSFVLWDSVSSRLLCARDPVGVKPFHYATVGNTFLFASELHALFAHPGLARRPNEGMIAELMCDEVTNRDETMFEGVWRLPAAHLLLASDGGLSRRRYWSPRIAPEGPERGDDEYAACFLDVFRRAVVRRAGGEPRVASQLSGGLDSTAVTAIAAEQLGRSAVTAFSVVHDAPACDERAYAATAAQALGVETRYLEAPVWDPAWVRREAGLYLDWAGAPNGTQTDCALYAAASAEGFTAMLTGEGGDEWFTGSAFRYADLLVRRDFTAIAGELHAASSFSTAWKRLMFGGVWPILPGPIRNTARRFIGRRAGGRRFAPWMREEFAVRTSIDDRRRRPEYDAASGFTRASWDIAQYLADGWQALCLESIDRSAARHGVEERHPFYDLEVIEFALSLPEAQRCYQGESKRVMRRALSGIVPDSIRCRRGKADFSSLYLAAFTAQGSERMFQSLAIAEAGWVKSHELERACRDSMDAVSGGRPAPHLRTLWSVFAIEHWYRSAILGQAGSPADPA